MIRINLLPVVRPRSAIRIGIDLRLAFGAIGVLITAAVALASWALATEIAGLRREIEQGREELAELTPIIAEGPRQRTEQQDLERRLAAIEGIARTQARPAYLLDALADLTPRGLRLTRAEEKGQQLKLNGVAGSSLSLAELMVNLEQSGRFKGVDLIDSRQDLAKSPRSITFEVVCRFEI